MKTERWIAILGDGDRDILRRKSKSI